MLLLLGGFNFLFFHQSRPQWAVLEDSRGCIIGAWPLSVVEMGRGCRLTSQSHIEVWLSLGGVTVEGAVLEAEVCLG